MPMIRYQIRNEYALADPELYRAADKDDPEALLEGVAMAGLVGVLRQLGDLAEFAAEIFHALHEELMANAARGHGLMLRVQQLEAEVPSIEKAFLSQCSPLQFNCNAGTEWHSNIRIDQNLITRGDMPRFILDSYEECRGPPRLFMLDKFDKAGAGACLKRYSDPSFFKSELASSGIMGYKVQKEKRARKVKKKVSRWRNGGAVESSLITQINSDLQQVSEKNPARRVKLKARHIAGANGRRSRSYMEIILEEYSPKEKVLEELEGQSTKSINLSISAPEDREILSDNLGKYLSSKEERNPSQPPIRQTAEISSNGLQNHKANSGEFFETIPEPFWESKKLFSTFQTAEKNEMLVCNEGEAKGSIDSHSSNGVGKDTQVLDKSSQGLAEAESITERFADGCRSDDIGSEVETFMDDLNTLKSEIETDSENKPKSEQGFSKGEIVISETRKGRKDFLVKISEPEYVQDSATPSLSKSILLEGLSRYGVCSLASTDVPDLSMLKSDMPADFGSIHDETHDRTSEELHQTNEVAGIKPIKRSVFDCHCSTETSDIPNIKHETGEASDQSMINSAVPANFDIILDETHYRAFEELHKTNEVAEIKFTSQPVSDGLFNMEISDIPNIRSEIGSSGSCVTDLNSTIFVYPQGIFDEAQSITLESIESSCHLKNDCKVGEDYDHNLLCKKVSSQARQSAGLPIGNRDLHGFTHPVDNGEELLSEDMTIEIPEPVSLKQDGTTHEQIASRCSEDLLLQEPESRKHDMEALDGSISSIVSIAYPVMNSVEVTPGGIPAGWERSVQLEHLAVEMSPRSLTGTFDKNLDGSAFGGADIAGSGHPTKDGEELEEMADINGMHDDFFQSQRGIILQRVPTRYFEDLLLPLTMRLGDSQQSEEYDTELSSERRKSTSSQVVSPATSHISLQLTDINEKIQNSVVSGEQFPCAQPALDVKNSGDIFKSDNLANHVVMKVMACLSDVDEPEESCNVEAGFVPSCSVKAAFSGSMELLSDHDVITGPQTARGDLRWLSVSKASDIDDNTVQTEESNRCDHEVITEPQTAGGALRWLSVSEVSAIDENTVQTEGPNLCDHVVITEPQAVGGGLRCLPVSKASDIDDNTVQNEGPNQCDHEVITEPQTSVGGLRWLPVYEVSDIDENTVHTEGPNRRDNVVITEPQAVVAGLRWLPVSRVSDIDDNTVLNEGSNRCDHEVITEHQTIVGGLRWLHVSEVSDIDENTVHTEGPDQCDHVVITEAQAVVGGLRWLPVSRVSDVDYNTVQNEGPNRGDHEVITEHQTIVGGLRWLPVSEVSDMDENTVKTEGPNRCDHVVITEPQAVGGGLRWLPVSKVSDIDDNTVQNEGPNRRGHEVMTEPQAVVSGLRWLAVSKVSDVDKNAVQTEGPSRCDHVVITEPQAVGGDLRWLPVSKVSDINENTVQNDGPNLCGHEVITEPQIIGGSLRWLSVSKVIDADENTMQTEGPNQCDHEVRAEPQTVGGGLRWLSVSKASDIDENAMQTEGPNSSDDPINDVNVEELADCTETSLSFSSGSMQLQLNHEVRDETQLIGGGLRLPSGSKVSDIDEDVDEDAIQTEGPIQCDDSMPSWSEVPDIDEDAMQTDSPIQCDDSINDVTAEAIAVCTETHSRFSYELSVFSKQFQEDCVLSSADLDQHEPEISESPTMNDSPISNSENNLSVSHSSRDESCSQSASAFPDSEFAYPEFSDSTDFNLLNGFFHAALHERSRRDLYPCIDEDNSIHLLEERDLTLKASILFDRESAEKDTSSSIQPLVQDEVTSKVQAGDEPIEMSSNQGFEILDPSVQSEIACFVTQVESVNLNEKPSEPGLDSHTMFCGRNISELDLSLPEAGARGQLVSEVPITSKCNSEYSVNFLAPNVPALELELSEGIGSSVYKSNLQQFSEPQISCTVLSFPLQGVQETPPLPPLPPLEWRIGKLELGPLTSDRNLVQSMSESYTILASSTADRKHPHSSALAEANLFAASQAPKETEDKMKKPLRLSEFPPIVEDKGYQYVSQEEMVLSLNPSSPSKGEIHLNSYDASWGLMFDPSNPFTRMQSPESIFSQNLQIQGEKFEPLDNKISPLSELLPALELEISQYGILHMDSDIAQSASPCLPVSSTENDEYIYSFVGNVGDNMQRLSRSAPLSTAVPMIPHGGFVSSGHEYQFTRDDSSAPVMEDEKPNGKFSSIRNRPRHPLIDAVAAHDKSKLRKVSELAPPTTKPKIEERNTLLDQIRNKSFNLKPAAMAKPNVKGPSTNLKVTAILEKASAIRQACAGSDEDDDGNWSDS